MQHIDISPFPTIPSLDPILHWAIAERIFPGAVVLVGQGERLRHLAGYGTTMYDEAGTQPVDVTTWYDLASLTKMFTATAALRLMEMGELALERPAADYLPAIGAKNVTIWHLLTHTSALERRLSLLCRLSRDEIRAAVYETESARTPGSETAYVNINSFLLGEIVAHVSGQSLDAAINELLIGPLGMTQTCFNPPEMWRQQIAPTEWDDTWRHCLLWGVVHDDSAYAMGGVAGHAGLFSTAQDLWRFLQMWLREGVGPSGGLLLRPETVAQATRVQTRGLPGMWHANPIAPGAPLHAGLGWMLERPNVMGNAPADTYGHTGFTGPVIVNVPSCDCSVVLLSNRTYPRRTTPPPHHVVTAALLEEVVRVVGEG